MSESPRPTLSEQPAGRQFGLALIAGLIIVVILGGVVYWWSRTSSGKTPGTPAPLPMGAAEQAYAPQIQFSDFELSRASNMLEQEITYVDGTISNMGPKTVVEVEVQLEFHDLSQNVILRETRRILGSGAMPLGAGAKQHFQLAFEAVPAGWDQRPPVFTITGLRLK